MPLQIGPGEPAFEAALRAVIGTLESGTGARAVAVAHRIVHGGARYARAVRIDDAVLADLEALNPLAPLHQPHNLAGVRAFRRACPELPQVACFDTAFHAGTPEVEQRYALPEAYFAQGVRRYGFHGLSYQYVSGVLAERSQRAGRRLLLAHLGNGASLCAVRGGRSVATTMGFSALDGLMMGTRSGAIDAGVLLHLMRTGMDATAIERLLYRESGLLGVSGLSADMRSLRASADPAAARAIALFTHRVVRESGALVACLGGLDAIGFTGGIGEHDALLRAEVCAALAHLGVRIDDAANQAATGQATNAIHAADGTVEVWVVPTDEGRVTAQQALDLLLAPPHAAGAAARREGVAA
jgi:acetate kinase